MTATLLAVLETALRNAGIPIDGVSVGDPANRATWKAFTTTAATPAHVTQAAQILATVDVNDAALNATALDALATTNYDTDQKLRAVAQALWECIPSPTMTKVQLRARAIAILKTL